jgi:hypothetical protein
MDACTWPINYTACGATPGDPEADPPVEPSTGVAELDALTAEERAVFEEMASEYLWTATGQRFGVCDVIARPCQSGCNGARSWMSTFWGRGPYPWQGAAAAGGSWVPLLIAGQWYGIGCGCAGAGCSCSTERPSALRLPGPIVEVTSVKIDGVTLDPSDYTLLYDEILVRNDGTAWPTCQDLLAPSSALDTFEVAYKRGAAVPVGGQVAAGRLAAEFARAACDSDDCALPERLQSITRQGVTASFFLSGEKWQETGIWIIDSWVNSITNQQRSRPNIRSVDVPKRRGLSTMGAPWLG